MLSREGAENDTVGKCLLRNLTQEQHKCGICLWPSTVRAAQGNEAGSQNLSPLQSLFPSAADQTQNLLKACVIRDHVKISILGSAAQAFRWGLFFPLMLPGQSIKKEPPKHKSLHFANTIKTKTFSQNGHFGSSKKPHI